MAVTQIYTCKNSTSCTLMICLLLYVNYSSVKIHWSSTKPSGCFSSDYVAPEGSFGKGRTRDILENELLLGVCHKWMAAGRY